MPLPGKFNILVYQGDTFSKEFIIEEDVNGELVPIDFSNHEILGMIKNHATSPKVIAVFDIEFDNDGEDFGPEFGRFIAKLTSEKTSALPSNCVYDIQSVNNDTGEVKTWVYGRIRAIREVTRG